MKQNKGLLIGIVVIIVIVAGALLVAGSKKTDNSSGYNSSSSSTSSKSSSNKSSDSAALSNAVATNVATIQNYAFSPAVIKVKVGDTVTWTNQDSVSHNVVASTPSADAPNGPLIGKGETYQFTFTKAGTYTLHCAPHPYMHQIVEVTN
jgi:amicyanin